MALLNLRLVADPIGTFELRRDEACPVAFAKLIFHDWPRIPAAIVARNHGQSFQPSLPDTPNGKSALLLATVLTMQS
jgi:hypothetical protein